MIGRFVLAAVLVVLAEGAVTGAWSQKVAEEKVSAPGALQAPRLHVLLSTLYSSKNTAP